MYIIQLICRNNVFIQVLLYSYEIITNVFFVKTNIFLLRIDKRLTPPPTPKYTYLDNDGYVENATRSCWSSTYSLPGLVKLSYVESTEWLGNTPRKFE